MLLSFFMNSYARSSRFDLIWLTVIVRGLSVHRISTTDLLHDYRYRE